jgi:hypothetical protein
MTWKCSKCGFAKNNDKSPKCEKCGKGTNPGPQEPQKKQIEIPSWGKSLTLFAVGVGLFAILFLFSPLPKAISFILSVWLRNILATFPENIVSFISDFFIWWVVGIIVFFAVLHVFLQKPNLSLLFSYLGTNFLVIDGIFIFALIFWYAVINFAVLDPYLCTAQNTVTLSQFSTEFAQRCAAYQQSLLPAFDKQGTAQPLEITFGYYIDPNTAPLIPSVYQGQIYSFTVNLKNVQETEDLQGTVVKGYVVNDTCYPGTDCINLKSTGGCSEDNPCTLSAGNSLSVSLQSDQPIPDTGGSWLKMQIEVSYVDVAYGKGEFNVVRTLQAFHPAKPESKTGPIDVVIYFSPDYYFESTAPPTKTQGAYQLMYIAVANSGKGVGRLGNILIERIGDFSDLQKIQCPITWRKETITEGTSYDLKNTAVTKNSNVQFVCNIPIDYNTARLLLNDNKAAYQGIPFTATVGYQYFETAIFEEPLPVQGQRAYPTPVPG